LKAYGPKVISDQMHGILDYLTVAIFALAPGVVGLTGVASIVSYALAIIHLAMTVATKMPLSLVKIVPMKLHAIVELIVGLVLVVGGLLAPTFPTDARAFFVVMGVLIFFVWLLSTYAASNKQTPNTPS
jgi:hypothetical protein